MKQVLLIIGLCFATTLAFAQKAAVSGAEKIAKDRGGNINEARNLINGAMSHAETQNDPKTWFVAGQIEDAQFNRENTKKMLNQSYDQELMYQGLINSLPFFVKAYELDQRPNEKGKVAPKFAKNIKGILSANHASYLDAGSHYLEENAFQKAFDLFELYLEIANLPFFAGEKTAARDENYNVVQFFAGAVATMMNNPELAVKALVRAKESDYRKYDVYAYLVYEYDQLKDLDNMEKTLNEGMSLFPDSSYFLLNLINFYVTAERNDKAIDMLTTAIAKNSTDPLLYQALGSVYESGLNDNDKAEENYKKSLELDPENPVAFYNLGRIYYNKGIGILNDANAISDVQKFDAEKAIAVGLFKSALPFVEKAHQKDSGSFEYMLALSRIYYQLEMEKEFNEMEAKMGNR